MIAPDTTQLIVNGISALGLASVISLVAFAGLTVVFRMNLDRQREAGRQLVTKWLASRLVAAFWSEGRVAGGECETVPAAAEGDRSPRQTASNSPD